MNGKIKSVYRTSGNFEIMLQRGNAPPHGEIILIMHSSMH